jgi:hypothetical protein
LEALLVQTLSLLTLQIQGMQLPPLPPSQESRAFHAPSLPPLLTASQRKALLLQVLLQHQAKLSLRVLAQLQAPLLLCQAKSSLLQMLPRLPAAPPPHKLVLARFSPSWLPHP